MVKRFKTRPPFTIRESRSGRYWFVMALRGVFARKPVALIDKALFLKESGERWDVFKPTHTNGSAAPQKVVVH